METVDKSIRRAKAASLEALMKSKKMSRLVDEAWNEPSGSSKRDRLRSLMGSVHKAHSNYYAPFASSASMDGQGGQGQVPSMPQPNQQASAVPGMTPQPTEAGMEMAAAEETVPKRNVVLPGVTPKAEQAGAQPLPSPGYISERIREKEDKGSGTAGADFMSDVNRWINSGKNVYEYFVGAANYGEPPHMALGKDMGDWLAKGYAGAPTGYKTPSEDNLREFRRLEDERVAKYGSDQEMFQKYGGILYRSWNNLMQTYGPTLFTSEGEQAEQQKKQSLSDMLAKADYTEHYTMRARRIGIPDETLAQVLQSYGNDTAKVNEWLGGMEQWFDSKPFDERALWRGKAVGLDEETVKYAMAYYGNDEKAVNDWLRTWELYKYGTGPVPRVKKGYDRTSVEAYFANRMKDAADGDQTPADIAKQTEEETGGLPLGPEVRTDDEINVEYTFPDIEAMKAMYGKDAVDEWFNSIKDPSMKEQYRTIYEKVQNGESANSIVWSIMKDPDTMAKVLDVPKEYLKYFPQDGSLAGHIIELRNATEDKFKLDETLYKITQKKLAGANVESNVSDYIRGKDAYLAQIDKLLFDSKESMADMDTSNPYVEKRMKNYQNYLTILKGRQNQRYIDFMDMSVRQHNSELDRLQANYDAAAMQAEKEFTDVKALTTEKFLEIKDVLTDMACNVTQKEDKYREKMKYEQDMLSAGLQNAASLIDIQFKPELYKAQLELTRAQARKATADADAAEDAAEDATVTEDSDWDFGELAHIDDYLQYDDETKTVGNFSDPIRVWNLLESSTKVDSEQGYQYYLDRIGTNIESKAAMGEFGVLDAAMAALNSSVLSEMSGGDSAIRREVNNRFINNMGTSISNGVYRRMKDEAVFPEVMDALKDLTGNSGMTGWFSKPMGLDDRKSFVSGHSQIGQGLAGALFDTYAMNIQPNPATGQPGAKPENAFDVDGVKPWKIANRGEALESLTDSVTSALMQGSALLNN